MKYKYNQANLDRHKVSISDVNEVLSILNVTTRDFDLPLSKNDNLRIMFVGYTYANRLLEIGVEFFTENKATVFHAQTISPKYRKLYEERITNE